MRCTGPTLGAPGRPGKFYSLNDALEPRRRSEATWEPQAVRLRPSARSAGLACTLDAHLLLKLLLKRRYCSVDLIDNVFLQYSNGVFVVGVLV